jgi:hypothetical protein
MAATHRWWAAERGLEHEHTSRLQLMRDAFGGILLVTTEAHEQPRSGPRP